MLRVTAVVFDSHDNSLVMQFNNGGIRMYRNVSEVRSRSPVKEGAFNTNNWK